MTLDKDAAEKRQVLATGAVEDRKRIIDEAQRLNEATNEARSRLEAISQKISEQESKIDARDKTDENRLKQARQELAKLQSTRAQAERELQQKVSEQNAAASTSQRKAAEIAAALADVQRLVAAKDNAERCATEIKGSIEALNQKADELRLRQKAEALKAVHATADHLLDDLSEFAKRNPSLIPLEIGPLVAGLKKSLATDDDFEKCSQALEPLQKRLDEIPEFKGFRLSMEETRQRIAKAELDDLVGKVQLISDFLESYVRKNITSDFAQDLLKLKGSVSEALVSPETDPLREVIAKCEREFDRLLVVADYNDFRAKHPQPSRRLQPQTTDGNRYLVEGPLDETVILVNESGRAGVIRNLRGDFVFENGKASLCFPHETLLTRSLYPRSSPRFVKRKPGLWTSQVPTVPQAI